MLNYAVHAENSSLYNTPPAFAIYALGLVMKWLLARAGCRRSLAVNERKAAKLYAEIDRTGFYRGTAHKDSRSLMNITFRLPSEDLEKQFVKESTAAGLDGLKGHRSVGGMRASIYNAFPEERRRRARRVHAGVRAKQRIGQVTGAVAGRNRRRRRRRRRRRGASPSSDSAAAAGSFALARRAACSSARPVSGASPWISSQVSASRKMLRCVSARCARGLAFRSRSRRCSDSIWRSRSTSRRASGSSPSRGPTGRRRSPASSCSRTRRTARLRREAERHQQAAEQHRVGEASRASTRTARGRRRRAPATATTLARRRACSSRGIGSSSPALGQAAERLLRRSGAQNLVVLLEQPRRRAARDLVAVQPDGRRRSARRS